MQRYQDFAPTSFDQKGLNADSEGIANFGILLTRNRDSGILDESNFAAALSRLGGESDDVQIHRFGHWACGWFELLLVRPDTDAWKIAEDIESSLESYPALDDEDLSEREVAQASELGYVAADDYGWLDSDGNRVEIEY